MVYDLMYIELKTGYADDGPAWIGYVMTSKSGKTIYFNDHAFQRWNSPSGNYYDIESKEDYWISGVKKRAIDTGPVMEQLWSIEEQYLSCSISSEKKRFLICLKWSI